LLNTEKALSVILGIFLSVAIAFILGAIVQWIARLIFTFIYRVNGKTTDVTGKMGGLTSSSLKIGIFGGIAVTSIIWFLLINGLKNSSFMTPEIKELINANTWLILGGGFAAFSIIMTILSAFKVPVLKFVVLLGTFALAMAFAGNDLVNFVGVPLTGLDAYNDFTANGDGNASSFLMKSLMEPAHTPIIFLVISGLVMVLALVFSKKAQHVVKTSVDLSRQDEGEEMFGSSGAARIMVRTTQRIANTIAKFIPKKIGRWIDSRFNSDSAILPQGAAFDTIRAAVNLVLAGLLVAFGTSMRLPLSTTYVTFMVAMGTSLADRAWSRESAVFRITGVLSVIGGWFLTAGVAFIICYLLTNLLHFGSFVAMGLAIAVAIFLLVRSNLRFGKDKKVKETDKLFKEIMRCNDKATCWSLVRQHVSATTSETLQMATNNYKALTTAFFYEDYRTLKRTTTQLNNQREDIKRQRRKQIVALRQTDPMLSVEKGTWYFLINNSLSQMVYCLKRMNEPCREHVGNNFHPVPGEYATEFMAYRDEIVRIFNSVGKTESLQQVRESAAKTEASLSDYRKRIIRDIQTKQLNIETMTVFLNLVQESQLLLSALRHTIRGVTKFEE